MHEDDGARVVSEEVLAGVRAALGESLVALRLLPALSGAATVLLTGLITSALGGGRFAQALACLSAVLADVTNCEHCMPFENGAPIFVCLGLNQPLARRWLQIRTYR